MSAERDGDSPVVLSGCNPVILLGYLTHGGSERQGCLLAGGLAAEGLRPGVVAWNPTQNDAHREFLNDLGIPIASPPQDRGAVAKIRWLRRVAREVRPSVLHAYTFFLNAATAWAMRGVEGVAIGSMRGDYAVEAPDGALYYAVNRLWPKTLITNSARTQAAARADRSPFHPRHILFVPNGLDLALYRRRVHEPVSRARIVGVGSLYPGKRWDRVINAVAGLQANDSTIDFSLDVIGEGPERHNLERLIADLGVGHRVSLLGNRNDVPDILACSDLLAFASDSEGMPNVVLEAMAAGLPVLATDAGDIPLLVENGVHGYVVPVGDDGALAGGLRALVRDHELRARMGAAAFTKSHAQFGLDRLVENTLDAYRQAGARV